MEEKNCKCLHRPPVVLFSIFFVFFVLLALYFKFVGPIPLSIISTVTTKTELFTAVGEGKVTATPEIAKVNLGITVNRSTVKEAQNEANSTINKISGDIKKLGVEEKDIKTTSYNINPSYDWTGGKQRVGGYQVSINLQVKVRDFDKINSVIDTATADGANLVGGLQFTLEDDKLKELQNQARGEAVEEAKEKAESLAKAAGINLGRVVNVQEGFTSPVETQPRMVALEAPSGEELTEIEPGEQEIKVNITLSYEVK